MVEAEWAKAHPEKAQQMREWFSGKAPKVDWSALVQKEDAATRAASAACLGILAEQVPNMICASADLSNSDKTDGFLKKTRSIVAEDFGGAFFQAGVSELTMACMCIGMYLHGGVIPACGTFFVFSDYMKPAVRMAALMRVPIKFIWTHDAFRVGEDGPTHEPVEQEAQIRLMEKTRCGYSDLPMSTKQLYVGQWQWRIWIRRQHLSFRVRISKTSPQAPITSKLAKVRTSLQVVMSSLMLFFWHRVLKFLHSKQVPNYYAKTVFGCAL